MSDDGQTSPSAQQPQPPQPDAQPQPPQPDAHPQVQSSWPGQPQPQSPWPATMGAQLPARRESFRTALAIAVACAVAGIVAWVIIAESMHARTALIAFGVAAGAAAGFRRFAPTDRRAAATIVAVTVVSAVLGLLASQYALVADAAGVSFMTAVDRIPASKIPDLMTTGTTAITWVIMAAAVYAGWRFAMAIRREAAVNRQAAPPPPGAP